MPASPPRRRLPRAVALAAALAAAVLVGQALAAPGLARAEPAAGSGLASRTGERFLPSPTGAARLQGLAGYAFIVAACYLLSARRRDVRWRTVGFGLALQAAFALVVLNPRLTRFFFHGVDAGVRKLLSFAEAGIDFLFQSTAPHQIVVVGPGGPAAETFIGRMSPALKSLAFWVLPTVIFFASLIAVLYHYGVMQAVVRAVARAMMRFMKTSGAETLSCTANIFVGQTEAPLLVKPFVATMTTSELMAVMTGGFGTVAGGILAIYVGMLHDLPGIAGHLVTASIMAAPASLAVAKLLVPETGTPVTAGTVKVEVPRLDRNGIEAAARGASEGMTLVLNIAAMLVAFVGLVALVNAALGLLGDGITWAFGLAAPLQLSLERILGWVLSPLAWGMGVPWSEATVVGELLGKKLVLTELLAYLDLRRILEASEPLLSERSAVIASYALCGFANVASIGIQIGGIGGMAPERRGDLARLGLPAMAAGALVSCLSGTIAGFLV